MGSAIESWACELTALSDIWTGDAMTAQTKKAQLVIPTGLLGSVRWWFEVLVRGLGGAACDPSAKHKPCQGREHCLVCELLGCSGWGRKVRFDVRGDDADVVEAQLKQGTVFRFLFTPMRSVRAEEWALLKLTLRLI